MQEPIWHYTDRAGKPRGPANANLIRDAIARGDIPRDARFWREGLADWVFLDTVAAELGVAMPVAGAPAPLAVGPAVAPAAVPQRPKKKLSGCLVAVLVALGVGVLLVGALAVIGVVEYDKYTVRAQVSEGAGIAEGLKYNVEEYHLAHGALPASNADIELPEPTALEGQYVDSIEVQSGGAIVARYSSQAPQNADASIEGATLVYTPTLVEDGKLIWRCDSDTLPAHSCPSTCVCAGH